MSIIDFFKKLFGCECNDHGHVHLAYGKHEIKVKTRCHPCKVYLSTSCCNHQVCGDETTLAGSVSGRHHFILFADVKSNSCTIHWIAEECGECCNCC
jgi:hypothetical protein